MQQRLMRNTAVAIILFFFVSMGLICYLSAGKVITIADVAQDEVHEQETVKEKEAQGKMRSLTFQLGDADSSYLRVPLPEGCKAENIVIENHYMDKQLWLMIGNAEENFYYDNVISGNREMVESGTFDVAAEGVKLNFQLTGIYECRTILENNNLYISFLAPKEMYDRIVVIDPACGGLDSGHMSAGLLEKNINLQIAKKLKEKLDESDIKAYYTRMDDVNPSQEERIALGNETKADMYIRVQVNASEDTSVYGTETIYNGHYFIPGFGSVELADYLEREVVTSIRGKALGLIEAGASDYAIKNATVPAAAISVGYISNAQEVVLLGKEEYIDKIASGIYEAIIKAYEEGKSNS